MIFELLILVLGIPVGLWIAWNSRDELVQGRRWFKILIVGSGVVGFWSLLNGINYIFWTAGFVVILSFTALIKSRNEKWVKV